MLGHVHDSVMRMAVRHRLFQPAILVPALVVCVLLLPGCAGMYFRHNLESEGFDFPIDGYRIFTRYDVISDSTITGYATPMDSSGLRTLFLSRREGKGAAAPSAHTVVIGSDESLGRGNTFIVADDGDCLKGQIATDSARFGPWKAFHSRTGRLATSRSGGDEGGVRLLGYGVAMLFEEGFAFEIPTGDLAVIASSGTVVGRVCTVEFTWDEETLEGLRRYLELTGATAIAHPDPS